MIKVNFLGPIGLDSIEIEASNFDELKARLYEIKELQSWLPICAIALNDTIINEISHITLKHNDTISLLPPVCGG